MFPQGIRLLPTPECNVRAVDTGVEVALKMFSTRHRLYFIKIALQVSNVWLLLYADNFYFLRQN
jgi:hypothetical protein